MDQAKETFLASENACADSNLRLRSKRHGSCSFEIDYMRRWISHVLGVKPNLLAVYDKADFSSGASLGVHGNATNLYRKLFAKRFTVTQAALPYALGFVQRNENLFMHLNQVHGNYVCFDSDVVKDKVVSKAHVVSYNKLSFVPKTAKTHRVIAVEPLLNSVLQKGVDTVMREKLRRVGYNLTDQSRNQVLAKEGSVTGNLATMDLSAASDSISIELARILLPWDWFDLLNRLRSPQYELDGAKHRYEKFCSMGNGFCFPLETLFFAAAARAVIHSTGCKDRTHAVYGDDIIVPVEAYDRLELLLAYLGFKTNASKSFKTGPFRESCGADWYMGQDVRPVYLDYALSSDSALRIFHNASYRGVRTDWWFVNIRPFLREQVLASKRFLRPLDRLTAEKMAVKGMLYDEQFVTKANLNGAFDVEMDTFMSCAWAKWNRKTYSWSWKEWLYKPVLDQGQGPEYHRAQYLVFLRGSPQGELALRRKTKVSTIVINNRRDTRRR
jgi:hypothetical protein